ncbi:MAG: hypothetical protein WKI04_14145 [Ferruginibacter sp.]
MKLLSVLLIFCLAGPLTMPVQGAPFPNCCIPLEKAVTGKLKKLSITSSRKSVDPLLNFTASKTGKAIITIFNDAGNVVLKQTSPVREYVNRIRIKGASGLAEGAYTVRLISNDKTYETAFMIWK